MLVATIREYPWTASKVWAIVWEQHSQDGMCNKSVHCSIVHSEQSANEAAKGMTDGGWPKSCPRVVEVVHGSENRLFFDANTVIDHTVGDLFRGQAWHKETMNAVYDACERIYALRMKTTSMMESARP